MKTIPPEQEYHDNGTQKESLSEERICYKSNFKDTEIKYQCYSRNSISNDCQNSSESDNLIVCNPGLASSFQTLKTDKHKLSPGHYLQRVFLTSVAQKFRSQSLPNCLDKRKQNKESLEDPSETSVPLVESVILDDTSSTDAKDCATEGWFKTWPERGVDKTSNLSVDTQCEQHQKQIGAKNIKIDKTSSQNSSDEVDFICDRVCRTNKFHPSLDIGSETKRSDKESHCVRFNRQNSSSLINEQALSNTERVVLESNLNGASSNKTQSNLKSVRLDELLDSFPLAYSPITRQLLLIKSDAQRIGNSSSEKNDPTVSNKPVKSKKSNEEVLNLEDSETDLEKPVGVEEYAGNSKGSECDLAGHNLHRVNTEVSSFSSTVSSLSDISPTTNEDSALGSLLDHGDTCSLVSIGGCSAFSEDSVEAGNKKKSLTGFFSRNVFNWKSGSRSEDSFGRWKLFGKNSSPLSSHSSLTVDHYAESDRGSLAPDSPCSVRSSSSVARLENRVASSSALIQLDRPANLPAKSEEEQARHRAQYQQILDAAKKKELKEAKLRKKQLQQQLKAEEQLAQAIRIWTQEILPRWDQMHGRKKARDLWWQGVPPCVRGKVWRLAIGNSLNLTHALYNGYVQRAQGRLRGEVASSGDDKEASMELIQLDISRTFPHLCIFQRGGPYYDMLHCLLAAYVCYRPDVGYVQGMSFIAAVLILNMEAADAFVCFANLLNRPCHRAFFHLSQPHMQAYYSTYDQLFRENLPQLYSHFTSTTLTPDLYLLDWIYTVFTKTMNLDLACRVWDVFLRDGEEFLFQTALGVLHLCQDVLLQMDFVRGSQFLTRLPDDLPADQLFKSISCIRMSVGKQTFHDILALHSADLDVTQSLS